MKSFVITIARGYGSGGKTVGKMLAEDLNVSYYDKEISRLASEQSGIHERLFAVADEQHKSCVFKRRRVYQGGVIPPNRSDFVSADNLFNYQAKVIKEIAQQESCVIVGRCADFVLGERENVVRVFVYASPQACVQNVMDMYGLTQQEAKKRIEQTDRTRSAYYKYYTGHDWTNAQNYDLCIDTSRLGFEKSAACIKGYLKIRGFME